LGASGPTPLGHSSDNQREASIDDQIRLCVAFTEREGWTHVDTYRDAALSGASTLRPSYQRLLEDARTGKFDVLVAEGLDRLSRDQADTAMLFKLLSFAGVRMVTLSEGEIRELHVGLMGTMNGRGPLGSGEEEAVLYPGERGSEPGSRDAVLGAAPGPNSSSPACSFAALAAAGSPRSGATISPVRALAAAVHALTARVFAEPSWSALSWKASRRA
jgi:hypothetical protein